MRWGAESVPARGELSTHGGCVGLLCLGLGVALVHAWPICMWDNLHVLSPSGHHACGVGRQLCCQAWG